MLVKLALSVEEEPAETRLVWDINRTSIDDKNMRKY